MSECGGRDGCVDASGAHIAGYAPDIQQTSLYRYASSVNREVPDVNAERLLLTELFGATQDFSKYPWQPFRPGVEIHRIYGDGERGPAAALLRYAAGAHIPPHRHGGYEHIIVLSGEQRDADGSYGPGSCLIHADGTAHDVTSEHGCVVLAFWYAPVVFVT
jgi:anti-sigma factor ChrR (cupin superfamily)